uniref:SMP-30/Gluconolactonase/LRE-like region domain-containing protein n=1 Tax=Chaetoceros debilis TaxID=122233 RepID=A0A7S3V7X4_9STRA
MSSMCARFLPLLLSLSALAVSRLAVVSAQGCSNTCPPINFGKPVESLCEGDTIDTFANIDAVYSVCHPTNIPDNPTSFALSDFRGSGKLTVVANYYSGCNAGRRESGVFAHVAQRFFNLYGNQITFIQSLKGGGTCNQWSNIYQDDATDLYPGSNVVPTEMPLSVDDVNSVLRDDLFTTPFGHPSYVIMDEDLKIRHKFIGPCCGYESYFSCTADVAKSLDAKLTEYIFDLLLEQGDGIDNEQKTAAPTASPIVAPKDPTVSPTSSPTQECEVGEFGAWSECSIVCGSTPGTQFRYRKVIIPDHVSATRIGHQCPVPIETRSCLAAQTICDEDIVETCTAEAVETVANGFDSPRDVAFHPSPGLHLGEFAEGRSFHPDAGAEAWVVNGANHSVSIVASLGTEHQTTISRRDRGYYHYMINGTALAFNSVADSGRTPDRDGFNYWSICNDNPNTYLGKKEANYFMGPTLYNSDPNNGNTVNRIGDECREEEPCYFLHSDMLHEAPACIGMAHDPEIVTTYGHVYWAFDTTGNREHGQLVRFDYQQPHGPGSMDHSVAAIRRYVEVKLTRGPQGVHAGMIVHPTRREVYISVPGANQILAVDADSGSFARTAREEYPIYSNRLPSFEYSIWECAEQRVFADGIDMPSGMALSTDGERLYVAERASGNIHAYEVASGAIIEIIRTGFKSIGGMAIHPTSPPAGPGLDTLFFVDDETGTLNKIEPSTKCMTNSVSSRVNPNFVLAVEEVKVELGEDFSIHRDLTCAVNPVIPDSSFFDQVHNMTGYADSNPDVQSVMSGMDASAALLANRTDCGYDSELNFDALLLGGYYCHTCLPEQDLTCDNGGLCSNVQWLGYTCDNEFLVSITNEKNVELSRADGSAVDPNTLILKYGVTYRFTVLENSMGVGLCSSFAEICAKKGPLFVSTNDRTVQQMSFNFEGKDDAALSIAMDFKISQIRGDSKKNGMNKGAMIGTVVAVVTGVFVVAIVVYRQKKRKSVN